MKPLPFALLVAISLAGASESAVLYESQAGCRTNRPAVLTPAAIPVQAGVKHRLTFLARTVNGGYTVETNLRIRNLAVDERTSRVRLAFLDGERKRRASLDLPVLSERETAYGRVFYPPDGAVALRLEVLPGQALDFACREVALVSAPEGREAECVNVHPCFDYGDLNGYGYRSGYGGGFYTRPDGRTVWNSGFVGLTPAFPVRGGAYYTFTTRGKAYERKAFMELDCYRKDESKSFKSMRLKLGEATALQVPAEAVRAELRCYYVILEEFAVSALPDAAAAEKTDSKR